ncbi:MAG TPA: phosphatase PAP2 family protein [Thermoplasmata archaeon]|nr:phosphatase PAP2 family protein [Thermoplasmata archaeon]
MGLNEDLFRALNGAGNPVLDPAMIALGVVGLSFFTFAWALPLWFARRERDAVDLLLVLAVTEVLVFLLKAGLGVPRPTIGTVLAVPFDDVTDAAFPSGHAARAFALATLLTLRLRDWRWSAPLFLYASLVGVSRIYVGVHWPSDVLGGAILGSVVAVAIDRLTRTPAYAKVRERLVTRLAPLRRAAA